MAPLKRTYDVFGADTTFDFDASVEISMMDNTMLLGTSPPFTSNKKFKVTSSPSPSFKKDQQHVGTFLDFDEVDVDVAVVNAPTELVSGDAWLNSTPGSPVHADFGFYELPTDDSSSDSESGAATMKTMPPLVQLAESFDVIPFEDDDANISLNLASDRMLLTDELVEVQNQAAPQVVVKKEPQAHSATTVTATTTATSNNNNTTTPTAIQSQQQQQQQQEQQEQQQQPQQQRCTGSCCVGTSAAFASAAVVAASTAASGTGSAMVGGAATTHRPSESDMEQGEQMGSTNRWAHNSTERKRRCEIRRLFSSLRDLFPDLHGDDRTSNINTLNRAIQCVGEMTRKAVEQETALRLLRERNSFLKQRIAARNGGVMPVTKYSQQCRAVHQQQSTAQHMQHSSASSSSSSLSYPQTYNYSQSYPQTYHVQEHRQGASSCGSEYPQQYPQTVANTMGHAASTHVTNSSGSATTSQTRYIVADTYPQYVVEVVTEVPVSQQTQHQHQHQHQHHYKQQAKSYPPQQRPQQQQAAEQHVKSHPQQAHVHAPPSTSSLSPTTFTTLTTATTEPVKQAKPDEVTSAQQTQPQSQGVAESESQTAQQQQQQPQQQQQEKQHTCDAEMAASSVKSPEALSSASVEGIDKADQQDVSSVVVVEVEVDVEPVEIKEPTPSQPLIVPGMIASRNQPSTACPPPPPPPQSSIATTTTAPVKKRTGVNTSKNAERTPEPMPVVEDATPLVFYSQSVDEPVAKLQNGALTLVAQDPSARKALPSALRQLLDHNGRGGRELQPLPRRRQKPVRLG